MKYPLNISLQIIESYHREISTHKLAKIILLWTKIHNTKFKRK